MNSQPNIDPCLDGIRAHACIKHIPQWPDNGPRMMALRVELQTTGLCQPVQMTAKHEIVDADSRERWRAAKMLQLTSIPIAIVPDWQAVSACLNALVHRRHLTKSAQAYLAWPILEPALAEARDRRHENLRKGQQTPDSGLRPLSKNAAELAEQHGFDRHFIFDAKKVHEIFAKDAAFKAQMEPRLLAEPIGGEHEQHRPVGLGAIIAGFAGKQNEDKPRMVQAELGLFVAGLKIFCNRAPLAIHETQTRRAIAEQLEKLSPEELDNVQRTAALVVSEAKSMAKGAGK